jgi:poly(A) polymerase
VCQGERGWSITGQARRRHDFRWGYLIISTLDCIVKKMPVATMENFRIAVKPETARLLSKTSRFLAKEGIPAFLVGGFVRDVLLGRETKDIDIAVGTDAIKAAAGFAAALGARAVPLDEENGVVRMVLPDEKWQIDFTTLQGDIETDLGRRDFTIDAMAVELNTDTVKSLDASKLIDPFHGREDLQRRMIKAVSETIFEADAVRLIRAVRIAAELGFNIEIDTEHLIRRESQRIVGVPGERVREELLRLLALPGAGRRLAHLDGLGLLTALIPELVPARGVDQPLMHFWDVFEHSLQTVAAVEFLLREGDWEYAGTDVRDAVPWSEELSRHFDDEISHGSTRRSLLKLAALLHDIAKPQTKTVDDDGRARFLGHPQEGAATAATILERLRFSKREIQLVELLVKYHLRPTQMSQEGMPTRRAIYRYFRDTGEAGIDLLFLSLADHLAARGPALDGEQWQAHARMTAGVLDMHFNEASLSPPLRLIDGNDVMDLFGLSPGPKVGTLLEAVREAQAAGEINNRQQALAYIEKIINRK